MGLGYSYLLNGRGGDAISEFSLALELSGNPQHRSALAQAYAVTGKTDEARKILDDLIRESEERPSLSYYIAQVYVALNSKQEALSWLERAYEDRNLQIMYLKVRPVFDSLRDEPQFKDLLRKINLASG